MPKTPAEDIRKRLLQGYDPNHYASLYRQMCYAFGDDWNKNRRSGIDSTGGSFPDWPEITVRYMEVGRSRRILNSQFIGLSRSMGNAPAPEFPQLSKQSAEVRKQFYLARYHGNEREDSWADEHAAAYMDGDGLGAGFVHFGLKTNPKTGYQYVSAEHSPAVLTLYDRHERHPGRARWVCFVKYLAIDQASALFGEKVAKTYVRQLHDNFSTYPLDVVRVFDYYDMGWGPKGTPTRALIPGDFANEPLFVEENTFECLPFSHMTYLIAPGMRRPTGRIVMQMATQEGLNEIERHLRKALKSPTFNLMDVTQLNAKDLARLNAGDANVNVRIENPRPDAPPYIRIPGAEVAQTILALRDMYERQFNADSGTTDFERGNMSMEKRTLGENELLDSRSQTQSSWSQMQAVKMHQRSVEVALKIAEKFDKDPVLLDIFGTNALFNEPSQPHSWMSEWLQEPSRVLIGDDQLRARDAKQDQMDRLQMLSTLAPEVQAGLLSAQKFAEEKLRALNEDPGDWQPQMAPSTEIGGSENAGLPGMVTPA